MRYLRYAFLAVLAVGLISLALANREVVSLRLVTDEMAGFTGLNWTITLPLFLIVLGSILTGILIGFIWEWLREHKQRSVAAANRREKERLEREVSKMRDAPAGPKDDILALLEMPIGKR